MKLKFLITILLGSLSFISCKKFLETKSDQALATPGTLTDLEAILNNSSINIGTALLNGLTDEYYFALNDWQTLFRFYKDAHVWDPALNDYNDWSVQYQAIFNANTVLFNLDLISKENSETLRQNKIRGAALFYRSFAFYRLLQLYALQYDKNSATSNWGIPLRLSADINEVSSRSKLQESYDRILTDLQDALNLLPEDVPGSIVTKTYPSKTAVHALLAKVYLQMGEYADAGENADKALQLYGPLMNFNDNNWVDTGSIAPFKPGNPEVILYCHANASPNSMPSAKIDPNLYSLYEANDLRKAAYFTVNTDASYNFKGSYSGNPYELFCGLATDELYLIRAECLARQGNIDDAMQDLNNLLRTRWKAENGASTFVDRVASDVNDALTKIIVEKKKELVYRETRWPDIKRLNKELQFAITLTRQLNGQSYILPPNDLRFALLIPREVLNIADLPQNAR